MSPKIGFKHSEATKEKLRGHKKVFCVRGHKFSQFGRNNDGQCKECRRLYTAKQGKEFGWKNQGIKNESGQFLTLVDYDRLYQIQGGCCRICGRHQVEIGKSLYADHDHVTAIIRGLLCLRCNAALGFYENHKIQIEKYVLKYQGEKK